MALKAIREAYRVLFSTLFIVLLIKGMKLVRTPSYTTSQTSKRHL
ncbi:MAG: hypothetical protein ACK52J_02190 [bacterium]